MPRLEVTKDVTGQRIWFYPQEGRPSATPTVQILDKYGNTITAAANTYVTQSTVNTTVATQNSLRAKSLELASLTGVEYRKSYLITNSLSQTEWVRVDGIDTGNTEVDLDEPLERIHDTSATFQGTSFYHTLQTTEVDELVELYRARAVYTVDSVEYNLEVPFDVVLVEIESPLTVEFMKKFRPNAAAQEGSTTRGTDFADLREAAWDIVHQGIRDACKPPNQWRPSLIKSPSDLEQWALAELDLLFFRAGVDVMPGDWDPAVAKETLENDIITKRTHCLGTLKWLDENDDDGQADDEVMPSRGADFVR